MFLIKNGGNLRVVAQKIDAYCKLFSHHNGILNESLIDDFIWGNNMAETLRLTPVISVYPDDNYENLLIEVILPGVEKKDISFKIDENSFYVAANKEGVTYLDSYSIACPVDPEKTVAKYSNGVLKVTVPYQRPLEKLFNVKIE